MVLALAVVAAATFPATARAAGKLGDDPLCTSASSLCTDVYDNPGDEYVGHDEPSVAVQVRRAGLRQRPHVHDHAAARARSSSRTNNGAGTTWNFQLRPTFWFGHDPVRQRVGARVHEDCIARLRRERPRGPEPDKPDYIGKHPGNAYMELQFYGPGYVPQFEGFGCTAHQYCAAMTIDSLASNQNTGRQHERLRQLHPRRRGADQLGVHHPRRRLPGAGQPAGQGTFTSPDLTALNPDYKKDLLMNPGDRSRSTCTTRRPGFRVDTRRPDDGPERVDDRVDGQWVRPHPVHAELDDLPGEAVRLPPRVLDGHPAWEHLVRAHLQHRLLRRDRALRALHHGRRELQLRGPRL